MSTYCLKIQYDGSRYNGWQKQGNTKNTIQEKMETTLSKLYGVPVELAGSGRTDAGVHALGQMASFRIPREYDKLPCEELPSLLNQYLPLDIRILHAQIAPDRFHARLHAQDKTYEYHIDTGAFADVFLRKYALHIPQKLDLSAMQDAADHLIGTHDFLGFCSNKRMKKSSVRTIYEISFRSEGRQFIISYRGNGFLYHMVRILTGTLIEAGLHQRTPSSIDQILKTRDRSLAGYTAAPEGLFLAHVSYPEELLPSK